MFWSVLRQQASVPERSKGFDSSSNVFVLVGSNPTGCKHVPISVVYSSDCGVVITFDFELSILSLSLPQEMENRYNKWSSLLTLN